MITTVEIPVLDLGPYLAGDPGADARTALALRHALFLERDRLADHPDAAKPRSRCACRTVRRSRASRSSTASPVTPTCRSASHPPRDDVPTYEKYLAWFTDGNYRGGFAARP